MTSVGGIGDAGKRVVCTMIGDVGGDAGGTTCEPGGGGGGSCGGGLVEWGRFTSSSTESGDAIVLEWADFVCAIKGNEGASGCCGAVRMCAGGVDVPLITVSGDGCCC